MRVVLLLILTAFALAACMPAESEPAGTTTSATTVPKDEQSCRVAGGTWRPVCLMGKPACVVRHADADKTCRDGDECKGKQCRHTGKQSPDMDGKEVTGKCVATSDPCGCFALVEDGKIQGTLCVD